MDISFSGAGFMGCYYFGVVDCWNKYIPKERVNRVAGASAGSLIAAYYLMGLPLNSCLRRITELTEDIRRRPLGVFDRSNQMVDVLPKVLDELFPEDAHKRVSNKLHVVMTRLKDMKKIVVNEFESKKDLIDALNCSCFIPVWSGNHVSTYKGVKHIDGGFSDNLPVFDEHTIRICCFSGASDISPYDKSRKEMLSGTVMNTPLYFTFTNLKRGRRALFPPPADYMLSLLESGFHDTKTFILDNDLIQCEACWSKGEPPCFSQLSPSISPAISRANSTLNLNELGADSTQNQKRDFLSPADANGGVLSSFNKLLTRKLRDCSKESAKNCSATEEDANNNLSPSIVIEEASLVEDTLSSPSSSNLDTSNDSGKTSSTPTKLKFGEKRKRRQSYGFGDSSRGAPGLDNFRERRTSLMANNNNLLLVQDRFKLAPEPLPSCPPSPNLNRQCSECSRLRQEARIDNLHETVRLEAEKFKTPEQVREGIASKLRMPLRWIRQLGSKSSYKLQAVPGAHEIPAL